MKKRREARRPELRVELRPGAGEVIKPERRRVDAYALVEVRTGLTLRWSTERRVLEREKERLEEEVICDCCGEEMVFCTCGLTIHWDKQPCPKCGPYAEQRLEPAYFSGTTNEAGEVYGG